TSMIKQFHLLDTILHYYDEVRPALQKGAPLSKLLTLPILEGISKAKLIPENELHRFDEIRKRISEEVKSLLSQ
ncbi:MAG: V-type ATP synthase subunit A, partial [Candidatus Hydrogenedentes bacterium]|nr:V-type ATP synthase subunit A [Candidatus Hydrogenedentota bacterium]